MPERASQHITAGPYSPVLEIACSKLVVISGATSTDMSGKVLGDDVPSQTRYTLENCKKQLASAGCTFEDVIKTNVYITDLDHWDEMNKVYSEMMPKPFPARTCVGTKLLPHLLIEIEMWAAKK